MGERWTAEQVVRLAPDAASGAASRSLAAPENWAAPGASETAVWGLCRGGGARPYQTVVDLTGPAYRCSCPSRKFPCKHALALLLLWSEGVVPSASEPADFAVAWLRERRTRSAVAQEQSSGSSGRPSVDSKGTPDSATAARRGARVGAGLEELDRWLGDQVRLGLAVAGQIGGDGPVGGDGRARGDGVDSAPGLAGHLERMAARMVDAQAPGVAAVLRRLPGLIAADPDWPGRLLEAYAGLRLLVAAHRRLSELPAPLVATVRARVGYPVATADVRAAPAIRDRWVVLALRDTVEGTLTARRAWLRGARTGRPALVLTFAPAGRVLDASLVPDTVVDADLHFYPGAAPLRALVGTRYDAPTGHPAEPLAGQSTRAALGALADALAADPWTESWPVLLAGVRALPDRGGWVLADSAHDALRVRPGWQPWRLLAVGGGGPTDVAGELGAGGLLPHAVLDGERWVRV